MVDVDWHALQAADREITRVSSALKHNRNQIQHSEFRRDFLRLNLFDGLVCRGDRIVVPASERDNQMRRFHDHHGHESFDKLSKRLRAMFY
jgi:hypothetical protein